MSNNVNDRVTITTEGTITQRVDQDGAERIVVADDEGNKVLINIESPAITVENRGPAVQTGDVFACDDHSLIVTEQGHVFVRCDKNPGMIGTVREIDRDLLADHLADPEYGYTLVQRKGRMEVFQ